MASPTTAITRHDLSLTYREFENEANRRGYIGLQVLPAIGVGLQAANFSKIPVEALLGPVEDTRRAPNGDYARDDFEWEKDSYQTDDHGVEETVDDRLLKQYPEIRAEMIKRDRAINRDLQRLEYDIASAVFNTATWTGASLTTAVGTPWTTKANATPIDDIDAAIEKAITSCGMRPNALVITDLGLRAVKRCSQVQDLLKYSGRDDPKNLGLISGLQELFNIERIIVPVGSPGIKNTADEGQSATFARIWDSTKAMVCRVSNSMDLEDPQPGIGRTIMWEEEISSLPGEMGAEQALIVEEYREERRRGGVIRARFDYQVKIIRAQCGHLLTAVTA